MGVSIPLHNNNLTTSHPTSSRIRPASSRFSRLLSLHTRAPSRYGACGHRVPGMMRRWTYRTGVPGLSWRQRHSTR